MSTLIKKRLLTNFEILALFFDQKYSEYLCKKTEKQPKKKSQTASQKTHHLLLSNFRFVLRSVYYHNIEKFYNANSQQLYKVLSL